MAFLPLKFALATTDFAIFFLLLTILMKHTFYKFDIRSWSAAFNILCILWLTLRGAFWILTMCSINYWVGSVFYILFWVPTPISFGAYMLIPLFFAHLLYRTEWEYYWGKIWWVYTFTMVGLAVFMISWSILCALNLRHQLECIGAVSNNPSAGLKDCYYTSYSTNVFKAVTAVCFLFLAGNTAVFGRKLMSLQGFHASIYIGPSKEELYNTNLFLFVAFLSRGLYECLDLMDLVILPSIPLTGDADIDFMSFFAFMVWDYFPTLMWIVVVTGRDVIWANRDSRPEYSTAGSFYREGISYESLSEIGRIGHGEKDDYNDVTDEPELPYFYNADGMQMVVGTPAKNQVRYDSRVSRNKQASSGLALDGTAILGRRFAVPSSITPVNSWLSPTEEETFSTSIYDRGRSASNSGTSRSLIYGTFNEDILAGSGGSSSGTPLQQNGYPSSLISAASPKMPWPDCLSHVVAPPSAVSSLPHLVTSTGVNNLPNFTPVPVPSFSQNVPSDPPGQPVFTSRYYDDDDSAVRSSSLHATQSSPLIRLTNSPLLQNAYASLPSALPLPHTALLAPEINGQDYLNAIAAASFKKGPVWGTQGLSPSAQYFATLPTFGSRSRSSTMENPPPLPLLSPAIQPTEGVANIPGIWRPSASAVQAPKTNLRVITANNIVSKRATEPLSKSLASSPPPSPLSRNRQVSNSSYVSSSPDSSSRSNVGPGAVSPQSSYIPPPPPLNVAGVWQHQYFFTEDGNVYSDSSNTIDSGHQSPIIRAT